MRKYTKAYTRTCEYCSKTFWGKLNQKYCSYKCRKKSKYGRKYPKILTKQICLFCNKEFLPTQGNQKYCSSVCRQNFWSHQYTVWNKLKKPKEKINRICPICNNSFLTSLSQQIFCSKKCCHKANHIKKYKKRKKEKEEKKNLFCCECCNFPDSRALHFHHINHTINNKTMILCANCHNIYHSIVGRDKKSEVQSKEEVLRILWRDKYINFHTKVSPFSAVNHKEYSKTFH